MQTAIEASVKIAATYLRRYRVGLRELTPFLSEIHEALLREAPPPLQPQHFGPRPRTPAEIQASVTPDTIMSFENGRRFKTLGKHLAIRGLTPDSYRLKWGLPASYPMVATNYTALRSEIARNAGLGRRHRPGAGSETDASSRRNAPRRSGQLRKDAVGRS